ncbi:hypothetical protein [Amycolatopsis sp. NPDC001319]|uniref:hypothetical protein n=1 Tax=unclassified Amycolatopsis TaxID=2618356 RepID=UPI0036B0D451
MSIENPRQEADTPRARDFRWLHNHGLFRVDPDGTIYQLVDHNVEPFETAIEWTSLPADAVKLGDVGPLRRQLEAQRKLHDREMQQGVEAIRERDALRADYWNLCNTADQAITAAARERDALRADIRAVLDKDWQEIRPYAQFLEGKLGRIRAIVNGEQA